VSIDVDTREFQAAMKEAIRTSSRSAATVINGKHQDLLYKAYEKTPISKPTIMEGLTNPPAFVTSMVTRFKARAIFKASIKKAAKAETRLARIKDVQDNYRALWWNRIQGKPPGREFLRMGFVEAGKRFKRVNAQREGKVFAKPLSSTKRPIKAGIREAAGTGSMQVSASEIRWKAKGKRPGDASEKERILSTALARAIPAVTADTRRHMADKLAKDLAKHSAKGAR